MEGKKAESTLYRFNIQAVHCPTTGETKEPFTASRRSLVPFHVWWHQRFATSFELWYGRRPLVAHLWNASILDENNSLNANWIWEIAPLPYGIYQTSLKLSFNADVNY